MKIAITGANGFIGSNLREYFTEAGHIICSLTREEIDLLDENSVKKFFSENQIDILLHTAITGGRRGREDTAEDFYNNLKMFENLNSCTKGIKLLVNFASGAEYNRATDIFLAKEGSLGDTVPTDFYGLSKYIISQRVLDTHRPWINLRIFNCFGEGEKEDRMISSAIRNKLEGKKIVVHQNKYMDFFYIEDLLLVVDHYIKNINRLSDLPGDINLSYQHEKVPTLSDIASYVDFFDDTRNKVEVMKPGLGLSYNGCGYRLKNLGIPLIGIKTGIKNMFESLKKQNHELSYKKEV